MLSELSGIQNLAALHNYSQSVWIDNIWKSAHSVHPQRRNSGFLPLFTAMRPFFNVVLFCFILAGKEKSFGIFGPNVSGEKKFQL